MATFEDNLAGITDQHERAVKKAQIYCDPATYGVNFTAQRTFTYQGWTLVVEDMFLGLDGQAIGLMLRVTTPEGVAVYLDNPFYVFNPFYHADGVENPTKAFATMVVEALHDAVVKAGYEPPF